MKTLVFAAVLACISTSVASKPRTICDVQGAFAHQIAAQRDLGATKATTRDWIKRAAADNHSPVWELRWLERLLNIVYDHPENSPAWFGINETRVCEQQKEV